MCGGEKMREKNINNVWMKEKEIKRKIKLKLRNVIIIFLQYFLNKS